MSGFKREKERGREEQKKKNLCTVGKLTNNTAVVWIISMTDNTTAVWIVLLSGNATAVWMIV